MSEEWSIERAIGFVKGFLVGYVGRDVMEIGIGEIEGIETGTIDMLAHVLNEADIDINLAAEKVLYLDDRMEKSLWMVILLLLARRK